jgi:hypothetical protein
MQVARQHALLRKIEAVMGRVAEAFATALIQFSAQDQLNRTDMERITSATMRLDEIVKRLRDRGFDDFPGGAPLMAAVASVIEAADPVRGKIKQFQSIESYLACPNAIRSNACSTASEGAIQQEGHRCRSVGVIDGSSPRPRPKVRPRTEFPYAERVRVRARGVLTVSTDQQKKEPSIHAGFKWQCGSSDNF